jgi:hypothetical protein
MELWIKNVKFGLIHHSLPFINLQQRKTIETFLRNPRRASAEQADVFFEKAKFVNDQLYCPICPGMLFTTGQCKLKGRPVSDRSAF